MKIILASKSPRRRELLAKTVPEFDIVTVPTDESLPVGVHPREGVEILALRKGAAVLPSVGEDSLVISSDTLVELDGIPLGKPADEADALKMLMSLSGRVHHVHTGVAVHYRGRALSGVDSAEVEFRTLTEEEALEYIKTGEPMDKAGSYAIQGIASKFIKGYKGEFDAIVGLGLKLTQKLMNEALKYDKE